MNTRVGGAKSFCLTAGSLALGFTLYNPVVLLTRLGMAFSFSPLRLGALCDRNVRKIVQRLPQVSISLRQGYTDLGNRRRFLCLVNEIMDRYVIIILVCRLALAFDLR